MEIIPNDVRLVKRSRDVGSLGLNGVTSFWNASQRMKNLDGLVFPHFMKCGNAAVKRHDCSLEMTGLKERVFLLYTDAHLSESVCST